MIDNVVKIFEKFIQAFHKTAVIVLRKQSFKLSFKAYTKLEYSLWYIDRQSDARHELVTLDATSRVTNDEERKELEKTLDERLVEWMFEYVRKGDFNYVDE